MLTLEQEIAPELRRLRREAVAKGLLTEEQMRELEQKYSVENLHMSLSLSPRNYTDIVGFCRQGELYGI